MGGNIGGWGVCPMPGRPPIMGLSIGFGGPNAGLNGCKPELGGRKLIMNPYYALTHFESATARFSILEPLATT